MSDRSSLGSLEALRDVSPISTTPISSGIFGVMHGSSFANSSRANRSKYFSYFSA